MRFRTPDEIWVDEVGHYETLIPISVLDAGYFLTKHVKEYLPLNLLGPYIDFLDKETWALTILYEDSSLQLIMSNTSWNLLMSNKGIPTKYGTLVPDSVTIRTLISFLVRLVNHKKIT